MKRLLPLFLILLHSVTLCAEKLEDRYVTRLLPDGLLFFIVPYELPNLQKEYAAELDVTYIIQQDSITLNMSVLTANIIQTDSIQFVGKSKKTITDFETFFIDKSGKKFIHRYSCRLPYSYFEELYYADIPFQMNIYADKGQVHYGYSAKSWQKERTWMQQIMLIIKRNQQKNKVLQ